MNHSDTILVALDDSAATRNAAGVVMQIAQKENLNTKGILIVDEALVLDPYLEYQKELGWDAGLTSREELIKMFEAKGSPKLDLFRSSSHRLSVSVETWMLLGGGSQLMLDGALNSLMLSPGR